MENSESEKLRHKVREDICHAYSWQGCYVEYIKKLLQITGPLLCPASTPRRPITYRSHVWGTPGGPVVKNLPCNARDMGLIPGPGRSHMPQSNWAPCATLLSLCSRAWDPQLPKPTFRKARAHPQGSHYNKKPAHATKSSPRCIAREGPHINEDPAQPKWRNRSLQRRRSHVWFCDSGLKASGAHLNTDGVSCCLRPDWPVLPYIPGSSPDLSPWSRHALCLDSPAVLELMAWVWQSRCSVCYQSCDFSQVIKPQNGGNDSSSP